MRYKAGREENQVSIICIGRWGKNAEGVHTYTLDTTSKEEIYQLIDAAKSMGWKFWDTPNILSAPRNTFHVKLKLYYPKELGYPEESS